MSNLYTFWKAIAQGKPARLAVYTRRRRTLGGSRGGESSVAGARRPTSKKTPSKKPSSSAGAGRKKVQGRSAVSSSKSGSGSGVTRKRVVVNKSANAASARATSASLVDDGDKYAARLERINSQPLGGNSKEKKLLETLRELAKYRPDTAELNAAAALTSVIKRLSRSTKSSNVKQLATKRLSEWEKIAKMRDLKEGKQKRTAAAAAAVPRSSGGSGGGTGSGPRHRARRSSLPPMRLFRDVCSECDPGLKECVSSAKPSLVASTLRSLTMLGKYRPKPAEIEAAVDTINSVKALRNHESTRVRDESKKLYAQWKAVILS